VVSFQGRKKKSDFAAVEVAQRPWGLKRVKDGGVKSTLKMREEHRLKPVPLTS
jgi:hypothetical protein